MIGLCERFHCLPSQLYDEPVDLIRLVKIVERGRPEQEVDPDA